MHYRWDPPYPAEGRGGYDRDNRLRASDAERNAVSERLATHFAEGRLDQAEFKARLDRAMGATTRGDLEGLFDDLPPLEDEPQPRRRPRLRPLMALAVIVVLVAVTAQSTLSVFHVPWLLVLVAVAFLWSRTGGHHREHRAHHHADR
jgi:Domain of unknown function (DUF1707)